MTTTNVTHWGAVLGSKEGVYVLLGLCRRNPYYSGRDLVFRTGSGSGAPCNVRTIGTDDDTPSSSSPWYIERTGTSNGGDGHLHYADASSHNGGRNATAHSTGKPLAHGDKLRRHLTSDSRRRYSRIGYGATGAKNLSADGAPWLRRKMACPRYYLTTPTDFFPSCC